MRSPDFSGIPKKPSLVQELASDVGDGGGKPSPCLGGSLGVGGLQEDWVSGQGVRSSGRGPKWTVSKGGASWARDSSQGTRWANSQATEDAGGQ